MTRLLPSPLLLAFLLSLSCTSTSAVDPIDARLQLQDEIRRTVITTKSLGRFGLYALLQEDLSEVPCLVPLSAENRICDVHVIGRGHIRLVVAAPALEKAEVLRPNALVAVEYPADCGNQSFDFKSLDNGLRRGPTRDGLTTWRSSLVLASHKREKSETGERCSVRVEAAPELLQRLGNPPPLSPN